MLSVQVATTPEKKQEIYQFRYRVYVEEMNKNPRYANHIAKVLTDKLDDTATLLYVSFENRIVATLRRNFLDSSTLSESLSQTLAIERFAAIFPNQVLSFSSRLMVAPEWRSSFKSGLIITEAYRDTRQRGVQFDFLHAAPWLVPFYENLGYRRYTESFLDRDAGLQIPMVLVIEDVDHLQAVRSPFYRIARKACDNPTAKHWFNQAFPEYFGLINTCRNTTDEVWAFWIEKLHHQPNQEIDLFRGLSQESIQQLLKASFFHRVKIGETILRIGDIANAVFLVLSGVVEMSSTINRGMTRLTSYQTFGETTLFTQSPSPEQVIAKTDVELLVLPTQTIMKAMKTSPEVMCQFFLNASRCVCNKYVPQLSPILEIEQEQLSAFSALVEAK